VTDGTEVKERKGVNKGVRSRARKRSRKSRRFAPVSKSSRAEQQSSGAAEEQSSRAAKQRQLTCRCMDGKSVAAVLSR